MSLPASGGRAASMPASVTVVYCLTQGCRWVRYQPRHEPGARAGEDSAYASPRGRDWPLRLCRLRAGWRLRRGQAMASVRFWEQGPDRRAVMRCMIARSSTAPASPNGGR